MICFIEFIGIIDSYPSYDYMIAVVVSIPSIVPIRIPPELNSMVTSVPSVCLILSSGDLRLLLILNGLKSQFAIT